MDGAVRSTKPYPGPNGSTCYMPGDEVANSHQIITLDDYETTGDFTQTVQVTFTSETGFAYLNIHLDYGLKGTTGYSKSGTDSMDATNSELTILNGQEYTFSVSGDTTSSDTVASFNEFKKNPGFGGFTFTATPDVSQGEPIKDVKVEVYKGSSKVGTAYTDQDGWYFLSYKHTGKPTAFTVKIFPPGKPSQATTATVKSNSFVLFNFEI